jgi:hypothetical protein
LGFDNVLSVYSLKDEIKKLYIELRAKYDKYECSIEYQSNKDKVCQKAVNDFKEYFESKGGSITEGKLGTSLTFTVNQTNSGFLASLEVSQDKTLYFKIPEKEYYQTILIVEHSSNENTKFQGYVHEDELHIIGIKDNQKNDPNFYKKQLENIKEDIELIDEKSNNAKPEFVYDLYRRNIFVNEFVDFLNIVDKEI